MSQHQDILRELEEFERAHGVSPARVCRDATNNPRMYERLVRRFEQTNEQVSAIRAKMEEIKAASSSEGAA